jgi:hypothetical protein
VNLDSPFDGIAECAEHPQPNAMVEGCASCLAEFAAKQQVVARLAEAIQSRANDLAGFGAQLEPAAVVGARLDALVDVLFRDRNRIHFEVDVQRRLIALLDAAASEAARQRLLGGLQLAPQNGHRR